MMKKYTYRLLLLLFVFMTINLNAQPFSPPLPEPGTATIDGDPGEWDLINDFFADMREAGDFVTPKTLLSKVYLRYDCPTETLSILVLTEPGFTIVNSASDNWVKEYSLGGNNKIVDGNGTFSYISDVANPPNIIGYEASGTIAPGSYSELEVHAQIDGNNGSTRTSSTGKGPYIPLNLNCSVLPVELTSFSATISDNMAQLSWQTATEVNNYGFDVERQKKEVSSQNSVWEKLAFVEGHGNSNSPKYYSFTDNTSNASGKYLYRLKQIDIDGTFEYSDAVEINLGAPKNFELAQNYPNPFNPTTSISYSIPEDGFVTLNIYDVLGKQVAVLENNFKPAGNYKYSFDATNFSSGLYFYTIKSGKFLQTKKMLLMK